MELALAGLATWIGASVLAAAGWARFHDAIRKREVRAHAKRRARRPLRPQEVRLQDNGRHDEDAPSQRIA